jgi:hypothetical protein
MEVAPMPAAKFVVLHPVPPPQLIWLIAPLVASMV